MHHQSMVQRCIFYGLMAWVLVAQSPGLSAQDIRTPDFPELRIGEWRQHLPWQRGKYVAQSTSKVYFATDLALVELDKSDRSPRFITKVEGLSDVGIRLIRFNPSANVLVIAYENSNLDLWRPTDGRVVNLPFIRTNKSIIGDRAIYDMVFDDQFAYMACGFGIVKLNLMREEVVYTTFTGQPVYAISRYNGQLYAGTEDGLFYLPEDDLNPADFSRWALLSPATGLPGGASVTALCGTPNELFVGADKRLYRFVGGSADLIGEHPVEDVVYITQEGPGTVIGWRQGAYGRVSYRSPTGAISDLTNPCDLTQPLYAIEDGSERFWVADNGEAFRYYDRSSGICDRMVYDSPWNFESTQIAVSGGRVFVGTPGANVNLSARYRRDGVYIFENNTWRRFSYQSNPELQSDDCDRDLWRVLPHPTKDKFYAGSFVGGLVEASVDGASTRCFTQFNSSLGNAGASGTNRTAIGGMAFDRDGNMWLCNYGANAAIAVLKSDGTFRHFSGTPNKNLLRVVVDGNGYKWYLPAFNNGLIVYDSGPNIDSPADDRYRFINTANSVLPTNTVNCLAVDLNGVVWVGTQQGVVSFGCGSSVFEDACRGNRRIVTVDGFNGFLLETEEVRAIAVDGANRKWFGTRNGIFVQSPNGEQQIARYTATNSPLFDNAITDIAIDPVTGEVWIGTERGIQSLRSDAIVGGRVNSRTAYAYPNPVRPDYDGPIAIYGLARDANVKITDISGNLVYEGKALGGQAVWNGRDYLGRRVASGVYMIFATSADTFDQPNAVLAKLVVLN
jgi:hypothetical protein